MTSLRSVPMNFMRLPVILKHPTSGPKNPAVPLERTVHPSSRRCHQGMGGDAFAPELAMLSMTSRFMSVHWHAPRVLPQLRTNCCHKAIGPRGVLRRLACLVVAAGVAGCSTPGIVNRLVIDPVTPSTIYAGTNDGGMFKSTDSGGSWQHINTGVQESFAARSVQALAIDPTSPSALYFGAQPVFLTSNGGASWAARAQGMTLGFNQYITGLAVAPSAPTTVYAATGDFASCNVIYKSTDAGNSWTAKPPAPCSLAQLRVAVDPSNANTVYAVETNGGVFKSTDGGTIWAPITPPPPNNFTINDVHVDSSNGTTVYLTRENYFDPSGANVLKSTNSGASWAPLNTGTFARVTALAVAPNNSAILFAGFPGEPVLLKSTDGGVTWSPSANGLPAYANVTDIAVNPTNNAIVYASTDATGGVYKSTDGGGSWSDTALTRALAFGGGLVPPDNATFTVEQSVVKAQDTLIKNLDKCYRTGVKNLVNGKPDNITTCVNDPSKGALAKFDKTVAKLHPPKKPVPACIDLNVRRDFVATAMQSLNFLVYCSGTSLFTGGGLVPPDLATLNGEEGVAKAAVILATDLSKCSQKGVANVLKSKPDGVTTCTDAALAKFDKAIAKLAPPTCLDTANLRANALLAPQLNNWCAF
jgi:photosystem II stability/assembly factor-like uncharacterized protein